MAGKPDSIPGFANSSCYARALKGCSTQMSGEHPVSKAILKRITREFTESPGVDIKNMAFQPKDTTQSFGVSSLESRILCAHHNSGLSHLDGEALAAFNAFEKMHYAAAGIARAPERVYNVDGDRFERWMLKAVCGGLYGGTMRAGDRFELKGVEPPLVWLETLYRGKAFPKGFGLYSQSPQGDEAFTVDRSVVKLMPLVLDTEEQTDVHGLRLWLFGFRFTLLATGGQPRAVEAMAGQSYRPNGFTIDESGTRVNFAWNGGPGSGEVGMRFL